MFQERTHSLKYLIIFVVFILVTIIGATIYRIVSEVATSKFTNNSYSLLIVSKDSKLVYIDKNRKSALFLALGDIKRFVEGKNNLEATFSLGVPINGMIYQDVPPANINDFINKNSELSILFDSSREFKNLNKLDLYKIVSALRSANRDNTKEVRIDIFDEEDIKKVENDFLDSVIRNSNLTIEIDNGTSINGLGNLMAIILTRQGYNVIAVRNAKPELSSFVSYEQEKSMTTDSLLSLTGFSYKMEKTSQAADVTVYLGEDVDAMLSP